MQPSSCYLLFSHKKKFNQFFSLSHLASLFHLVKPSSSSSSNTTNISHISIHTKIHYICNIIRLADMSQKMASPSDLKMNGKEDQYIVYFIPWSVYKLIKNFVLFLELRISVGWIEMSLCEGWKIDRMQDQQQKSTLDTYIYIYISA